MNSMSALNTRIYGTGVYVRACVCVHVFFMFELKLSVNKKGTCVARLSMVLFGSPSPFRIHFSVFVFRISLKIRSVEETRKREREKEKKRKKNTNSNGCNVSASNEERRCLFATLFVFIWNVIIFPCCKR